MKALYSTMILSCSLFASCTNDELVSEGIINDGQGIKVTASLANGSRTTYEEVDGFTKTLWEAGDALGLFTDKEHLEYTAKEAGASTTFTPADAALTAGEGTTVYAYYPHTKGISGTSVPLYNLNQQWTADNKAPICLPGGTDPKLPLDFIYTSGTVTDNALNLTGFKHAFAFVKLTISKDVLHYDTTDPQDEYYTFRIKAEDGAVITDYVTFKYDITTEKISEYGYGMAVPYHITYKVSKDAFTDDNKATCYIAVLPTDAEGKKISFYRKGTFSFVDDDLMGEKTIPADGLKAGYVYPLELKAKPTESELALQGTYEYSVKNSKNETETGTVELVAAGDHTFTMKGLPGKPEYSATLEYSEEDGKERLTMKNWQLLEPDAQNRGERFDIRLNLINSATDYGFMKKVTASTDPSVEYVADREDVGGTSSFTFKDNGGFDKGTTHYDVKGFAYNQWSGQPVAWYFDLVLTKKADSSSSVDEVSGSIADMKENKL